MKIFKKIPDMLLHQPTCIYHFRALNLQRIHPLQKCSKYINIFTYSNENIYRPTIVFVLCTSVHRR